MEVRRKYSLIKPVTPEQLHGFLKTFYKENGCEGVSCSTCKLNKELRYLENNSTLCTHLHNIGKLITRLEEE